jgi:hypothetical protein
MHFTAKWFYKNTYNINFIIIGNMLKQNCRWAFMYGKVFYF